MPSNECGSCKDERVKKGLPAMKRIVLPARVTSEGFRQPQFPLVVCAYCDGETMVASALRKHGERQAK